MKPLAGLTVVELAGIGPGPFCGMLLADLGADVILVEREGGASGGAPDASQAGIFNRGKRSIVLDLKSEADRGHLMRIVRHADALIEGMRPGVAERLGVGPEPCHAVNPRLVYGRVTGWGQSGPLAHAAGHDLNYIALSGALWYASPAGQPPLTPPTLIGDLGGGALYLALGLLAGVLRARANGQGAVIDAAMVDGTANLMNLLLSLQAIGQMQTERGRSLLDGPHWCGSYRCADGLWISVQSLEPRFYAILLEKLGLQDDPEFARQYDVQAWPRLRERMAALFASRPRAEWCALLEGSDACFAPVLSPQEAASHPHNLARGVYVEADGVLQAAAAPRFLGEPAWTVAPVPRRGEHTETVLSEFARREAAAGGGEAG
ncbi:MAG: CoA transferase [Burkholderiales bacterium]|nr:MAG: CoA transferase [Burkholderiales bacterium]